MAGGRLAVRAARTLVARKLDGKLLRVVILQGNELRLLADGEDGCLRRRGRARRKQKVSVCGMPAAPNTRGGVTDEDGAGEGARKWGRHGETSQSERRLSKCSKGTHWKQ